MKEMYRLFILTILLNPAFSFGQNFLLEFDRYSAHYEYDWRGIQVFDNDVKDRFLVFCESNNLLAGERLSIKNSKNRFQSYLTTVDLNNDGLSDVIYNGPTNGEPQSIHIFINKGSTFKDVFNDRQGIVKLEWRGEVPTRLYTHDWGCCADPRLINKVYEIRFSDNFPVFELKWKSIELNDYVDKPKEYFVDPIQFKVDTELYNLRFSPAINDTLEDEFLRIKGNTIGKIKKGTTGTAYGSKTDDTGRVWWYVLIDPNSEIVDNVTNYDDSKEPIHVLGWISSRYVSRQN